MDHGPNSVCANWGTQSYGKVMGKTLNLKLLLLLVWGVWISVDDTSWYWWLLHAASPINVWMWYKWGNVNSIRKKWVRLWRLYIHSMPSMSAPELQVSRKKYCTLTYEKVFVGPVWAVFRVIFPSDQSVGHFEGSKPNITLWRVHRSQNYKFCWDQNWEVLSITHHWLVERHRNRG